MRRNEKKINSKSPERTRGKVILKMEESMYEKIKDWLSIVWSCSEDRRVYEIRKNGNVCKEKEDISYKTKRYITTEYPREYIGR